MDNEKPYIDIQYTVTKKLYNPAYGDDHLCRCGHVYYRHFDTYEEMANVGCKYCFCGNFVEFDGDIDALHTRVKEGAPEAYDIIL